MERTPPGVWVTAFCGDELPTLQLAPTDPREVALILTAIQGNYTAILRGRDAKPASLS